MTQPVQLHTHEGSMEAAMNVGFAARVKRAVAAVCPLAAISQNGPCCLGLMSEKAGPPAS